MEIETLIFRSKEIFWKGIGILNKVKRDLFGIAYVQNVFLDLRYGGLLGKVIPSRYADFGAYKTRSTNYAKLSKLFSKIEIRADDVLVDVGCGEGRVINYWLYKGCRNKIIGVELDEKIAEIARKRLKQYKNVKILCGDICKVFPVDGTLFYLYNPFDDKVLASFLDVVHGRSVCINEVRIVYNVPRHIDVVRNDKRWFVADLYSGIQENACIVLPRSNRDADRLV